MRKLHDLTGTCVCLQKRRSRLSTRTRAPASGPTTLPLAREARDPTPPPPEPPSPFLGPTPPAHPQGSATLLEGYTMASMAPVMQTLLDLFGGSNATRVPGALSAADIAQIAAGYASFSCLDAYGLGLRPHA